MMPFTNSPSNAVSTQVPCDQQSAGHPSWQWSRTAFLSYRHSSFVEPTVSPNQDHIFFRTHTGILHYSSLNVIISLSDDGPAGPSCSTLRTVPKGVPEFVLLKLPEFMSHGLWTVSDMSMQTHVLYTYGKQDYDIYSGQLLVSLTRVEVKPTANHRLWIDLKVSADSRPFVSTRGVLRQSVPSPFPQDRPSSERVGIVWADSHDQYTPFAFGLVSSVYDFTMGPKMGRVFRILNSDEAWSWDNSVAPKLQCSSTGSAHNRTCSRYAVATPAPFICGKYVTSVAKLLPDEHIPVDQAIL